MNNLKIALLTVLLHLLCMQGSLCKPNFSGLLSGRREQNLQQAVFGRRRPWNGRKQDNFNEFSASSETSQKRAKHSATCKPSRQKKKNVSNIFCAVYNLSSMVAKCTTI